jgi:hypothetical protein
VEKGLKITKKVNDSHYTSLVTKYPLTYLKIKIQIHSLNSSNKFLDIGIMNEAGKKVFLNQCINSKGNSNCHSYWGYGAVGMNGSIPYTSANYGFYNHQTLIIEFDKKSFTIKCPNGNISLSRTGLNGNYYFFTTLLYTQSSCTISRIE